MSIFVGLPQDNPFFKDEKSCKMWDLNCLSFTVQRHGARLVIMYVNALWHGGIMFPRCPYIRPMLANAISQERLHRNSSNLAQNIHLISNYGLYYESGQT